VCDKSIGSPFTDRLPIPADLGTRGKKEPNGVISNRIDLLSEILGFEGIPDSSNGRNGRNQDDVTHALQLRLQGRIA
jgi:hypothetical protein